MCLKFPLIARDKTQLLSLFIILYSAITKNKNHLWLNIIFYFEIYQIFFVPLKRIKFHQKWNEIL